MSSPNKILSKMLERLFAALVNGPSLNCRPHSSRQRVDWTALAGFQDVSPEDALRAILGKDEEIRLSGKVSMPRRTVVDDEDGEEKLSAEDRAARQAWTDQLNLLSKLRGIAEDAKTYEQDTGVHVLNVGFPLLSLPPAVVASRGRGATRRIVAPIAFVPVSVVIKHGATPGVVISCKGEGVDRVTPNTALLAWLEQQTGKKIEVPEEEEGMEPWKEIGGLVKRVCGVMGVEVPELFSEKQSDEATKRRSDEEKEGQNVQLPTSDVEHPSVDPADATLAAPIITEPADDSSSPSSLRRSVASSLSPTQDSAPDTQDFELSRAPKADDAEEKPAIWISAVLGLFPMANQGLLRDMQAMANGESLAGPVTSFIQASVSLDAPPETPEPAAQDTPVVRKARNFADERFVAMADPCQSRAVKLARQARGLVIHGPPGTGKSQTITNIIGDHLARGQRVVLVSDKRTALDVVYNRLEHMGLGKLVAVIHDPQRDQRELYRQIREQLEVLADVKTDAKAEGKLAKVDTELQELHRELTEYWIALMKEEGGESFHNLVGRWLAIAELPDCARLEKIGSSIRLDELDAHAHSINETMDRAVKVTWWENPWREAAGIELALFVGTPMDKWRAAMQQCVDAARAADQALDPGIPPFVAGIDVQIQADARADLANRLTTGLEKVPAEVRGKYAGVDEAALSRLRKKLADLDPQLTVMRAAPLDQELAMTARERVPSMSEIAADIGAIESYNEIARTLFGFMYFGRKGEARKVAAKYGLALTPPNAVRVRDFLVGLRARLALQTAHYELYQVPPAIGLLSDDVVERTLGEHRQLFELLAHIRATAAHAALLGDVAKALKDQTFANSFTHGLRASAPRAQAIAALMSSLASSKLFAQPWLGNFDAQLRNNQPALAAVETLSQRLDQVESVLRIRGNLLKLPAAISVAITTLLQQAVEREEAVNAMRRTALTAAITQRLSSDPRLQNVDGQRVAGAFERYRELEEKKRDLVRDVIVHQWTSKQQERLLAATGSRLGTLGAELKRRLTLRGERAMRLRQVLHVGQNIEGGDPLFDTCPVWMASPETVAQLFARKEVFSVVIFDEASQCRLEETLPVLTRGQRVVIAGDPKQLPPTRFFESAVAQSEDEEIETDQQLFESQQGEIEDLLGAALNIEIEQAYLDVHYRSRSAELIEFSNEHFYSNRLQAIPGHPSKRPETAPLMLHQVSGVYDKRENETEAQKVVEIVRELLKGRTPPSIGIACFNLQQRDLIVEKLDEAAVEDEKFGRKLAEARSRVGEGSFQGLFVKNLENVQGDERDHMIISTTYGPDKGGRFYRRFGPLGRAGGGRRLNVLVTRAREAVHLVTSIPPEAYRALPPVPQGQTPTGGWLLFAYLKYAEEVGREFSGTAGPPVEPDHGQAAHATDLVNERPTKHPSVFAESLAQRLADDHRLPSHLYWGNDGFCIDVALRKPEQPQEVTIGVLCDASRFANVEDPVEWDVFRSGIHQSQGWNLLRVWSPQFFRDPNGVFRTIVNQAKSE